MKKFTLVINYEEFDSERVFESYEAAHDYGMDAWFCGACGFQVYDQSGACVECK